MPAHRALHLRVALLLPLLLLVVLTALMLGSVPVGPADVLRALFHGSDTAPDADFRTAYIVIREVRLPRVLLAVGAGAALSLAGLLMQTVFRNPLAGPGVLGVGAGAGLGVALVVLSGIGAQLSSPSLIAALCGAGLVVAVVMAAHRVVEDPVVLLVLGLLFGYAASALTTLLMAASPAAGLERYVIWSFGSFALPPGAVQPALILAVTGIGVALTLKGSHLDALLLGRAYAESSGVHARALQGLLLVTAGVLTGVVTAYTGPISFVGVAVPHLARGYLRSSRHRFLVPATVLCGAILAVLADLIARVPGSSRVLPLNAVLALVGVPVVLVVVLKPRGSKEGVRL
ncbi:MAG: iron ABC transporter permease [Spirochaetaceae bacterium]|nr:MAG: iron ABC transporter permease [Spirochaetaceae bacterium]